jgi:hypothetical protein
MSATITDPDNIRMEAGISSFDDSEKILLIQDLPNRKAVRDFLIDLASSVPPCSIIIWDSNNYIKTDPKTKSLQKIWGEFVNQFKKIDGAKVVDSGDELTEKEQTGCVGMIQQEFSKYGKTINYDAGKLLISIVGYDRGMLLSDIEKIALVAPDQITIDFIIEHAFPTSTEAILYKFGNVLDTCSYESAIAMTERFIEVGVNHNVLAEIIVKKARWQLAAIHLWSTGLSWGEVQDKLMEMGKFPSAIWHHPELSLPNKKKHAGEYSTPETMLAFLRFKLGLPAHLFRIKHRKPVKKTKKSTKDDDSAPVEPEKSKRGEVIPLPFMAQQITDFIENKVVRFNAQTIKDEAELKAKLVTRAINVYVLVHEKLASIRYSSGTECNIDQNLFEMIRTMVNISA